MGPPILPIFPRFFFWTQLLCVAIPAWSTPGTHKVELPHIRCQRVLISHQPLWLVGCWGRYQKPWHKQRPRFGDLDELGHPQKNYLNYMCLYTYIHIYITFFLKGAVFSLRFKKLLCQIWRHSFSQFVGGEKKNKLLKTTSWGWIFSFNGTSSSFNRSKNCSFKCQRILNGACQRMTLATTEMDGGSWMDIDLSYGKLT